MPFKEALFWIGITVLGAGLFFVVDPDKTILGIVSIAVGLMCIYFSDSGVYQHHYPNKITGNRRTAASFVGARNVALPSGHAGR